MNSLSLEPVFLFPGQGAYLPGGLRGFAEQFAGLPSLLTRIDLASARAGGPRVGDLLTDRGAPSLQDLVDQNPPALHMAIFATEVALHEIYTRDCGMTPGLLVGHSFGEFAALVAAGCVDLENGVRLVAARDSALRNAALRPGGMIALRTGRRRAEGLVQALGDWYTTVAVDNGVDQIVVSGPAESIDRMAALAATAGVDATELRVPYPFHNRLLGEAAERFAVVVRDVPCRAPRRRVYSPVLGRYVECAEDVREVLRSHLVEPVRFLDALLAIRGDGNVAFVECGAKSVLTELVAAALVNVTTAAPLRQRTSPAAVREELAGLASGRPVPTATPGAPKPAAPPVEEAPPAPVHAPSPRREPVPAAKPLPDSDEVLADLRSFYAESVGYPEEVFEAGIELESDLGIDSIRQTELLNRAVRKYNRSLDGIRITDFTTLESISELISRAELAPAEAGETA